MMFTFSPFGNLATLDMLGLDTDISRAHGFPALAYARCGFVSRASLIVGSSMPEKTALCQVLWAVFCY
jgi:hypothetical protein